MRKRTNRKFRKRQSNGKGNYLKFSAQIFDQEIIGFKDGKMSPERRNRILQKQWKLERRTGSLMSAEEYRKFLIENEDLIEAIYQICFNDITGRVVLWELEEVWGAVFFGREMIWEELDDGIEVIDDD